MRAPRLPARARLNLWFRRLRFKAAWRLVRGMDGLVVSKAGIEAASLEFAKLPGWVDDLLAGGRKAAMITARIEHVQQFFLLACEIGDPNLQAAPLVELYTRMRMMTLSRRQKERMAYENAIRGLPVRPPEERRHNGHRARERARQKNAAGIPGTPKVVASVPLAASDERARALVAAAQ